MKNLIHSCVMMEMLVPKGKLLFSLFFLFLFFLSFLHEGSSISELLWLCHGLLECFTTGLYSFIKKNRRLWYCACSHQHVVTITISDLPLLHHDSYYTIAIVNVFKTIVQLYLFFFVFFYNYITLYFYYECIRFRESAQCGQWQLCVDMPHT